MRVRTSLIIFTAVLLSVLFLGQVVVYQTWAFSAQISQSAAFWTNLFLGFLSISFVATSFLAFRYSNPILRALYKAAAIWVGLLSFFFLGAVSSWIVFALAQLAGLAVNFHEIAEFFLGAALLAGFYGLLNASWTRVTRMTIRLANLPAAWRGRKAALLSDVHLGHVRNASFLRRVVAKILREKPDAIFIAGDLYDGTVIDARRAAEPLTKLSAPLGVYFVAGNHEHYGDEAQYLSAVAATGVRILSDEMIEVDGLQIVGIPHRSSARNARFASVLRAIGLDRDRASILLTHAPNHPEVAEAAGVSLQLAGHTHLGQFIPWSWIARRIYRQFVYGLSRIGKMQAFTSSGAGTWGPPLRLGSISEIVVLQFE